MDHEGMDESLRVSPADLSFGRSHHGVEAVSLHTTLWYVIVCVFVCVCLAE